MTFSREIMAGLCLAVVSVNTLLITLDLAAWARTLLRFRSLLSGRNAEARLVRGSLEGTESGLPRLAISLVGHGRGQGKIFFHARKPEAVVPPTLRFLAKNAGEITTTPLETEMHRRAQGDDRAHCPPSSGASAGSALAGESAAARMFEKRPGYSLEAPEEAWIWPEEAAFTRAFDCPDERTFLELAPATEPAKGAERSVEVAIDPHRSVYIYGAFDGQAGVVRSAPTHLNDGPTPRLIIAGFDPRAWALWQAGRIGAALVAIWISFAGLTLLCFQGPAFGLWSQLGALGLLIFFLLVQPLGVSLREKTALPHEVPRLPVWRRKRVSPVGSRATGTDKAHAQSLPMNSP